jgi:hypothetical protein
MGAHPCGGVGVLVMMVLLLNPLGVVRRAADRALSAACASLAAQWPYLS